MREDRLAAPAGGHRPTRHQGAVADAIHDIREMHHDAHVIWHDANALAHAQPPAGPRQIQNPVLFGHRFHDDRRIVRDAFRSCPRSRAPARTLAWSRRSRRRARVPDRRKRASCRRSTGRASRHPPVSARRRGACRRRSPPTRARCCPPRTHGRIHHQEIVADLAHDLRFVRHGAGQAGGAAPELLARENGRLVGLDVGPQRDFEIVGAHREHPQGAVRAGHDAGRPTQYVVRPAVLLIR